VTAQLITASLRRRARLSGLVAAQAAAANRPADPARFQITDVRLFPLREPVSGRSYGVVEVRTNGGIIGYGEGPPAGAAALADARRFWIGRPATAYVTAGSVPPLGAAMDMALLDITGKICRAPVYRLLGGPTRHKVRAFTSLDRAPVAASLEIAAAAGYRAFGVGIPAPAARNQGRAYQRDLEALLGELRRGSSGSFDYVLEIDSTLTAGDAATVAHTAERWHPLWLDEPCAVSNPQTVRKIAEESVAPLGFGRDIADPGVYLDLLRQGLIDVLRPDIGRHGISAIRRIAAVAETYYTAVAPRHAGGPIATAAALHLAATLPNFFIQQIPLPRAREDAAMRGEICGAEIETVKNGFVSLPTAPGLGISVRAQALEKYRAA
jgi:galactonate dehydratase